MSLNQDLILYFYTFSPYARKITAYLTLRGIPYIECQQPIMMPRPDLAAIGVRYRRIPVLSIGRDIYCDTALILTKLEQLHPGSHMGGKTATDKALVTLLQKWTDLDVFPQAADSIPVDFPAMNDAAFLKDREELWGREWSKERQARVRAEALQNMRANFEFLETLVSEDGKKWILDSDGPSLADINAIWVFDWLLEMIPGGLPEEVFSANSYPKTFAWRGRYQEALEAARSKLGKPHEIDGPEATKRVLGSDFQEQKLPFDEGDFSGVKHSADVEVWPIDDHSGRKNREHGVLVGLTHQEAVVEKTAQGGQTKVRVHLPRWNYRLEPKGAQNGEAPHHHPAHQHGGDEGLGAEHYQERQ